MGLTNTVLIEMGQDGSREYVNLDQIERIVYYDAISSPAEDTDDGSVAREVRKGIKVYFTSGECHEYTRKRAANLMTHIDPDLVWPLRQNLITEKVA